MGVAMAIKIIFLIIFYFLNGGDYITTQIGVRLGCQELNPIVKRLLRKKGMFLLFKIISCLFLTFLFILLPYYFGFIINLLYFILFISNIINLYKVKKSES